MPRPVSDSPTSWTSSCSSSKHEGEIAEGIETHAQLVQIQTLECDYAQGFLFAKPMPARQFSDWLQKHFKQQTPPRLDASVL